MAYSYAEVAGDCLRSDWAGSGGLQASWHLGQRSTEESCPSEVVRNGLSTPRLLPIMACLARSRDGVGAGCWVGTGTGRGGSGASAGTAVAGRGGLGLDRCT
jgi:hypothetical protein